MIRKPLDTRSLARAEELRNALLKHPELAKAGPTPKPQKTAATNESPDNYTLRAALKSFLDSRRARNCTASTIRGYESMLEGFLEKAKAENVRDVRHATEELALACCGPELSPRTRAYRRTVFGMFFDNAVKRKLLAVSPLSEDFRDKRSRAPKGHARKPFATAEVTAILGAAEKAPAYPRALLLFMLHSGARLSDAVFLRRPSVDFATGALNFMPIKSRCSKPISMELPEHVLEAIRQADTGCADFFFLDPVADYSAALEAAENEGDFLEAMPVNTVSMRAIARRELQKIFRAAGIRGGKPHQLRSTFACYLIRSGVDIFTVSEMLGHSNVLITQKAYLAVLTEHRAKMAKVTRRLDFTREPKILQIAA